MQRQLLKRPSILNQLIVVCGLGLLLGITSIWLPPYFVLVGIAGVIYLVVAWSWPEFAILGILLFTSTIFDIYALPSIPIGIGHLVISDILLFVLIGIIFLRVTLRTSSYLIHTPLDIPLIAFYGTVLLATAVGIFNSWVTFNESLGELRAINFYLMFFIVTNLVRDEKQLRRLYGGIVFLAIFVALAMFVQYALGSTIKIMPGRVETLYTAGAVSNEVWRILPPGQSLVLLVFISLVIRMLFDRTPSRSVAYLIQLGILGLAVLLTFNRSFWVAAALTLFLVGLLVSLRDKITYLQMIFWVILIGTFVVTPFLFTGNKNVEKLIDGVRVRMSTLFDPETTGESSLRDRYVENEYAYPQIALHPLIGLGAGAIYRPADRRIDNYGSNYLHNGHLYVMLKTGLIGYVFFMWFLLLFARRGFQNWERIVDPLFKGIILSSAVVIIGIQAAAITNPIFMMPYWSPAIGITLGLSEAILRMHRNGMLASHAMGMLN